MYEGQSKQGQAMVEYLIISAMMILVMSVMGLLLYTFREYGGRILDLIASVYP